MRHALLIIAVAPCARADVAVPGGAGSVTITVSSEPEGAKVLRADGSGTCTTPCKLGARKNDPSFEIAVRLDGYRVETRLVVPDRDRDFRVKLSPQPPELRTKRDRCNEGPFYYHAIDEEERVERDLERALRASADDQWNDVRTAARDAVRLARRTIDRCSIDLYTEYKFNQLIALAWRDQALAACHLRETKEAEKALRNTCGEHQKSALELCRILGVEVRAPARRCPRPPPEEPEAKDEDLRLLTP